MKKKYSPNVFVVMADAAYKLEEDALNPFGN